jgi:hypothetical protein
MAQDPDNLILGNNGLYCWSDTGRACGPDCMAFLTAAPEGPDYVMPDGSPRQWAQCLLLVNAHRVGKHLVHITSSIDVAVRTMRNEAADRRRGEVPAPAVPL